MTRDSHRGCSDRMTEVFSGVGVTLCSHRDGSLAEKCKTRQRVKS